MIFQKRSPAKSEVIIKKALVEIEKLLVQLEKEGKDLSKVKLRRYQKTHNITCTCVKCSLANRKKDPRLRGLREFGFKVFVAEPDSEDRFSEDER